MYKCKPSWTTILIGLSHHKENIPILPEAVLTFASKSVFAPAHKYPINPIQHVLHALKFAYVQPFEAL